LRAPAKIAAGPGLAPGQFIFVYAAALRCSMDDRERIIAALWTHIRDLDAENIRTYPAAARAIDAGAQPDDIVLAMTAAAYEATFQTLFLLTSEEDLDELSATGAVQGLHEDLLSADPTGDEGSDLFR
jgi:hypothetical protein